MSTKTNTEQERAAFEATWNEIHGHKPTRSMLAEKDYAGGAAEFAWKWWNRRAALQSQDGNDAAQAEWMLDDGRAPWAINSLKARIKEMRASEKRCRNAFRKDYMRVVSVYFADALGEAAEALDKRLSAIDHARRIEGDGE